MLHDLPTLPELHAAFASGSFTPRDLLERCLAHRDVAEPVVQAFCHIDAANARDAADAATARWRSGARLSALDGIVFAVKDIIDTVDMPTRMGSAAFADHRPYCDAACVDALRFGGGVLLGKTVTTELAFGRPGPTRNPHDPARTPGGSSSGAGAGAASGMFALGLGTQTHGSTLRPASFNGVVGFKPSHGALSMGGVHPVAASHDHLGTLSQDLDTGWAALRWMAEHAPGPVCTAIGGPLADPLEPLHPRRLIVLRPAAFAELDDDSLRAFEAMLDDLRRAGVAVDDADGALLGEMDAIPEMSGRMLAFDMRWPYRTYLERMPDLMPPRTREFVDAGARIGREEYLSLLARREEMRRRIAALADECDAIVMPASSGPAPEGLAATGSRAFPLYWSYLGFPAVSLPLMWVRGLPFGLQLGGFVGADHRLAMQAKWLMQRFFLHAGKLKFQGRKKE